jgi:hypothetical protein
MAVKSTTSGQGRFRNWGCLVRRERWTLSLRGKLLLLAITGGFVLFAGRQAHPFLALTRPVDTKCLIVEGWIPDYALDETVLEYRRGGYQILLTSGSIANDGWNDTPRYTSADWAAGRLKDRGLSSVVVAIPNREIRGDRTYHSALAVRLWIDRNHAPIQAVNVVTMGTHARRTRLLFRKALGSQIKVGIISIPDRKLDSERWWESSDGVRDIANEAIAYLYARFFFWPSAHTMTRASEESSGNR